MLFRSTGILISGQLQFASLNQYRYKNYFCNTSLSVIGTIAQYLPIDVYKRQGRVTGARVRVSPSAPGKAQGFFLCAFSFCIYEFVWRDSKDVYKRQSPECITGQPVYINPTFVG